ncbi:hypothetical protein WN51_09620 [Melipona quadrifasciata]|uniref:Uncharacterized protein n=1 Tax=Melipona quadrifasciata TaxID=166423 RepID=A0A0M8ZMG0_9HYME|nr:hypothetical protein WN51_09620 [Melipona quadrifasciata]
MNLHKRPPSKSSYQQPWRSIFIDPSRTTFQQPLSEIPQFPQNLVPSTLPDLSRYFSKRSTPFHRSSIFGRRIGSANWTLVGGKQNVPSTILLVNNAIIGDLNVLTKVCSSTFKLVKNESYKYNICHFFTSPKQQRVLQNLEFSRQTYVRAWKRDAVRDFPSLPTVRKNRIVAPVIHIKLLPIPSGTSQRFRNRSWIRDQSPRLGNQAKNTLQFYKFQRIKTHSGRLAQLPTPNTRTTCEAFTESQSVGKSATQICEYFAAENLGNQTIILKISGGRGIAQNEMKSPVDGAKRHLRINTNLTFQLEYSLVFLPLEQIGLEKHPGEQRDRTGQASFVPWHLDFENKSLGHVCRSASPGTSGLEADRTEQVRMFTLLSRTEAIGSVTFARSTLGLVLTFVEMDRAKELNPAEIHDITDLMAFDDVVIWEGIDY